MTKSAKRKKERTADFTKKRLKLGKGKQAASNAVDTSFKARSISLPQQTIAIDKAVDEPTTKRKLTLDDLFIHLKHYSPGMKRDALHGLHELLDEYEYLIGPNLSKLVHACSRLMADEDAAVRKALHSFLSWLVSRIPNEILRPYASTLLLFTASALSHIFPEIRIDAIRLLDVFLEVIPDEVVSGVFSSGSTRSSEKPGTGHGKKILDGYLSLLNVGTKFSENEGNAAAGPSSGQSLTLVSLSSASKALVLCSLATFLRHAVESIEDNFDDDDNVPTWFMSSSFTSRPSFKAFQTCLRGPANANRKSIRRHPKAQDQQAWTTDRTHFYGSFPLIDASTEQTLGALDMSTILADLSALSHGNASEDGPETASLRLISSLSMTMHPILISTFLDCAPSVFSPTQAGPEQESRSIQALMRISQSLYGYLLRNDAESDQSMHARLDLRTIVAHMSIYFPFGENSMLLQDMKMLSLFQELNVIYCELFSLQAFNPIEHSTDHIPDLSTSASKQRRVNNTSKSKSQKSSVPSRLNEQRATVEEYAIRCLRGSPPGSMPAALSLTVQSYRNLLPTLWWLVGRRDTTQAGPKDDDDTQILMSVLQHAIKIGPTSGVKRLATEFVGRLILLQQEPAYRGFVRFGVKNLGVEESLRSWLLHLPKVLWSIGDKEPEISGLVLRLLLRLVQRRSWPIDTETLSGLSSRLAPYFTMQHATRGEMKGPFANLARPFQDGPLSASDDDQARQYSELRRLALDVAAALITTSTSEAQSATQRIRNSQKRSLEGPEEAKAAFETLRIAVTKAVHGTKEEAYWSGISSSLRI